MTAPGRSRSLLHCGVLLLPLILAHFATAYRADASPATAVQPVPPSAPPAPSPTQPSPPPPRPTPHAETPHTDLPAPSPAAPTAAQLPELRDPVPATVSPPVSAPASPPASPPIEHVFVPLKEWKQKKLQDIERRINNGNAEQTPVAHPVRTAPPPRHARRCSYTNRVCRIAPHSLFTSRSPRCTLPSALLSSVRQVPERTRSASASRLEIDATPAHAVNQQANIDANETSRARRDNVRTEPEEEKNLTFTAATVTNPVEAYGPARNRHAAVKLAVTRSQPSIHLAPVPNSTIITALTREKPSQNPDALSHMDALLAIPMVADIMRSIKEASTVLSSSPIASINNPLRSHHHINNDTPPAPTNIVRTLSDRVIHRSTVNDKHRLGQLSTNRSKRHAAQDSQSLTTEGDDEHAAAVKEKPFNFASADAGARVLSSSNGVVGAKNVIEGSVDKYSLSPCDGEGIAGSRWIDLELSEDVILESVEAANFEYYSSSARRLAILGASSYPPARWNVLGIFEFADVRTLQKFKIENEKRVVTRFLRVMFAGKQGHEYYCPISTIRAFGKNLIADWKDVFDRPVGNAKSGDHSSDDRAAESPNSSSQADLNMLTGIAKRAESASGCHGEGCSEEGSANIESAANAAPTGHKNHPSQQELKNRAQESEQNIVHGASADNIAGTTHPSEFGTSSAEAPTSSDNSQSSRTQDAQGDDEHSSESAESTGGSEDSTDPPVEAMSEEDQIVLEAVRADALSSGSGDENIFRKVTRMIRLLELNQTLTNQYIDTHLARFAKALSHAQAESAKAQESAAMMDQRIAHLIATMEGTIHELRSAALKRDIVMCLLVVCVAFLLGTHWVLWTAVSGARLHGRVGPDAEFPDFDSRRTRFNLDESSNDFSAQSVRGQDGTGNDKRERRNSVEEFSVIGASISAQNTVRPSTGRGRSVSSTELGAVARRGRKAHRQVNMNR